MTVKVVVSKIDWILASKAALPKWEEHESHSRSYSEVAMTCSL